MNPTVHIYRATHSGKRTLTGRRAGDLDYLESTKEAL